MTPRIPKVIISKWETDPPFKEDREKMSLEERVKWLEERVDALYKSYDYDLVEKVWRYK